MLPGVSTVLQHEQESRVSRVALSLACLAFEGTRCSVPTCADGLCVDVGVRQEELCDSHVGAARAARCSGRHGKRSGGVREQGSELASRLIHVCLHHDTVYYTQH